MFIFLIMPKNNRRGQAKILEYWEYQAILNALYKPHHKLATVIAAHTGERMGAVLALSVDDVYENRNSRTPREQITFQAAVRKSYPKGKAPTLQIFTNEELRLALLGYKLPRSSWLFPSPEHGGHMSLNSYDHALRRALKRANLAGKGISSHSFRRTAITRLHRQGVPLAQIQEITGHKSVDALRRYVTVTDEEKQDVMDLLSYR